MKFKKIVCIDKTKLKPWAIEELQEHCEEKIANYTDYPETQEEVIERIGDAEVVFVSWHTKIDEEVIKRCPNLQYIGMCCSLYDGESANVAVNFARERGITVTGIRDYGDPGVVEFIISELVRLLHGLGEWQWKEMPLELTQRKIGIIGLGVTGQLLAKCLLPFGADLYYFSRTRKQEWEEKGVKYLPLEELLEKVEILSIHLPRNTEILQQKEFEKFGSGKILINTSLGLPFDEKAFSSWINHTGNFAIFDGDGKKELSEKTEKMECVITASKSAGWSAETHERLAQKVMENFREFMKEYF
ncbi:dihydrofolate reductase [Antarcticibacterium flavum]|uniref:Dihydrofolate reductase n=1 Tax=Antarcticibacterium flavum TaxID=2058175 RepID=A0A5B7X7S2_9FLAO|nr:MULTISPECIES: NAD(P)-dependent oxidoreductase [Antarcticibacterium]MCM4160677.1 dihydrofolate reductase [Antarcticibacterium sp. W02-3]QCY71175.1 dihydrofolate reductase [Antarcticibacterium flavum]